MEKNTALLIAVITLILGGVVGYYAANAQNPFSRNYIQGSALMMRDSGSSMMQMGQMMMNGGQMMQEKSQQYNDSDMMQRGKDLEQNGQMMQKKSDELTGRGNGMMQMMGQ